MRVEVNGGYFGGFQRSTDKHGNLERSRALGGCFGHAAERQSCLQRDVINYSKTLLKGTSCTVGLCC